MPLNEISRSIGRSERAIRLFLHRRRIPFRNVVKRNMVIELLVLKFIKPEYFNPTRDFYKAVGISQVRWWDLYHGRKPVTEKEYITLVEHFQISHIDAFESRQLTLFENDND